jgi:Inorganic pyrophosphatase
MLASIYVQQHAGQRLPLASPPVRPPKDGSGLDGNAFEASLCEFSNVIVILKRSGDATKPVDDKIFAILCEDGAFGKWHDISECPASLLDRLRHYALTYKLAPGSTPTKDRFIAETYGRDEAHEMIRHSQKDYQERFPEFYREVKRWEQLLATR